MNELMVRNLDHYKNEIPTNLISNRAHDPHEITMAYTTKMVKSEDLENKTLDNLSPEKQLGKLRRFLQTVYAFAQNLTSQKDTVKSLMVDLINARVSAEQFYGQLKGATKFPLRPFVVPFLKASLPLLRNSLNLPLKDDALEAELFSGTSSGTVVSNELDRKRRATMTDDVESPPPKRVHHQNGHSSAGLVNGSFPPSSMDLSNLDKLTDGISGQVPSVNHANLDTWTCQTESWRNIEGLFTTMMTTMERLRYAVLFFQQKMRFNQLWNEKFQENQRLHDSNLKMEEIQRRAETIVQEVKRVAVVELQKAVHVAEQRALHMIVHERAQMEKLLRDIQTQEDTQESCRNCGRLAGQTCSGCGKARYCGAFCQHRDWPRHKSLCGVETANSNRDTVSSPNASLNIKTEFPSTKNRTSPKSV